MDINRNDSEDDNPLALKSDFLLSLCELVIGGKEGLMPVEKTVIDRSVRNVYLSLIHILFQAALQGSLKSHL